jgi:methionyl-tRNA formyltransferase
MFDTVLLLTGPAEQEPLATALKRYNPQLVVRPVRTRADLESTEQRLLRRARLIGFLTPIVVPERVLSKLGFGAYNFHPGPPDYPGWLPAHFATYDQAAEFGVTVHKMANKVDAGSIIAVNRFAIPPNTGVLELEKMTFVALAQLFWDLAPVLATQSAPLPELPVHWGGRKTTRKSYTTMCEIAPDISKDELDRRVPVFGAGHFGIDLTVTLHGYRFRFIAPETAEQTEAPGIVPAQAPEAEKV